MKNDSGTILQRQIQLALGAEPDLLLAKNSTGLAEYTDPRSGKTFRVPYGVGGSDGRGGPDLLGILAPHGRLIGFECKAGSGTPSDSQLACHALWRQFGVVVDVVRSVDDARALLERARRGDA